jgi:hypothetical protein
MAPESILTRADYEDYLIRLYFGGSPDYLQCCLDRAYRDFSRTMHGLSSIETNSALYHQARAHLRQALETLLSTEHVTQEIFDGWHQQTCNALVTIYHQHQHRMYIGQAQKWINMTLKYVFTFGETRLPGFSKLYPFCHVPLDNIFMDYLAPYNPPSLSVRWSRITDYDEYLHYQQWVRERFANIPLDTEFLIWLGRAPSLP